MSGRDKFLAQSLSGRQTGLRGGGVATILFKPKTLFALLLVGIFSFAALVVLSGFADDLRKSEPGQATPRSVSAVGYKAVIDLLDDLGYDTREVREARTYWERQNRLIIYTPPNPTTRLSSLGDSTNNETQLIVLPKWSVVKMIPESGEPTKPGWARRTRGDGLMGAGYYDFISDKLPVIRRAEAQNPRARLTFSEAVERDLPEDLRLDLNRLQYFDLETRWPDYDKELQELLREKMAERRRERARERGEDIADMEEDDKADQAATDETETAKEAETDAATQTADEAKTPAPLPNHEVLLRINDYPVLIRLEGSQTYVLSEPDLINTSALNTQTGATVALSIFNEVTSHAQVENYTVDFDVRLHGLESGRNIIKLMLTPPFLAATLCLLAAGGLVAWQGFHRFGDPERVAPDYTQGPVSLARTAANFMEIAGRTHKTGEDYAALIRRQVIAALGYKGRAEDKTDALLQARETRLDITPRYEELLTDIRKADTTNYAQYAKALTEWRDRMIENRFQRKDTP